MKNSPLKQALICVITFGLIAYALWFLTQPKPNQSITPSQKDQVETITAWLTSVSSHPLKKLVIKQNNKQLISWDHPSPEEECELTLQVQKQYALEVYAEWDADTPKSALTLILEPDNQATMRETHWSEQNSIHELYIFHQR